jgi:hypothetical protein
MKPYNADGQRDIDGVALADGTCFLTSADTTASAASYTNAMPPDQHG